MQVLCYVLFSSPGKMSGQIPARSSWAKSAPSARIFSQFLLLVLCCMDSYLHSPQNRHQIDKENYAQEQKESHNTFYLHDGTERKHLGFGTGAIHSMLTSNPNRKNKPLTGKFDRRALILLYLLRSGDVKPNPGPVTTRQADQPIPPQANVATATPTTTLDPQITTGAKSKGELFLLLSFVYQDGNTAYSQNKNSITILLGCMLTIHIMMIFCEIFIPTTLYFSRIQSIL